MSNPLDRNSVYTISSPTRRTVESLVGLLTAYGHEMGARPDPAADPLGLERWDTRVRLYHVGSLIRPPPIVPPLIFSICQTLLRHISESLSQMIAALDPLVYPYPQLEVLRFTLIDWLLDPSTERTDPPICMFYDCPGCISSLIRCPSRGAFRPCRWSWPRYHPSRAGHHGAPWR